MLNNENLMLIEPDLIEQSRQETYILNAGLTGVVIDKDMIKNVSGKNVIFRMIITC